MTDGVDGDEKGRLDVEKLKPKDQQFSTYRGVRSMKHTKENKHYQDGLRKSSSLHDLSIEERESGSLDNSRFLSRSGDMLDSADVETYTDSARLLSGYGTNPYINVPRNQAFKSPMSKLLNTSNQNSNTSATNQSSTSEKGSAPRRGSFDDKTMQKSRNASERARLHRERSASMKSFPTNLTLPKIGNSNVDQLRPRGEPSGRTGQADGGQHENETDEHKVSNINVLEDQFCSI